MSRTSGLAPALAALLPAAPAVAPDDRAAIALGFHDGLNGGVAAVEAVLADDWVVYGTSPSLPSMGFEATSPR